MPAPMIDVKIEPDEQASISGPEQTQMATTNGSKMEYISDGIPFELNVSLLLPLDNRQ